MTNVLHALGGYDLDNLDQEFFDEEVPERNFFDDDEEDEAFLDRPHLPQRGRKSHSDDDAENFEIRPGGNYAQNNMGVNSQNTTTETEGTLRPSEENSSSEQENVDAVDQFLKSLTDDGDDDVGLEFDEQNEEDDLDFHFSGIDDCGYFADEPFKGNRTLELIDILVRISLSYAAQHGPIDQEEFKRLYYRIDFFKFSMFNQVTPDDLLGFKFLSGLISYEEYDDRLTTLEQHDT